MAWVCPAAAAPQACLVAVTEQQAGALPQDKAFVPASCSRRGVARAFYRDRSSGATRLAQDVAAGAIVPRYAEWGIVRVEPGMHLSLVVRRGAVTVAREVEALQEAAPGEKLFVRTHDGNVFAVRYAVAAP